MLCKGSLDDGLFPMKHASIAIQHTHLQSISTCEQLVWNISLMNIHLNTWLSSCRKVKFMSFIGNISENILFLLSIPYITTMLIYNPNTERFVLENMTLHSYTSADLPPSFLKLSFSPFLSGMFSWTSEQYSCRNFPTQLLQHSRFHYLQVVNCDYNLAYLHWSRFQWNICSFFYQFYGQIEATKSNITKEVNYILFFS